MCVRHRPPSPPLAPSTLPATDAGAILNLSGDLGKDVLDVGVGFVACSPPESECFMMLGRDAMEDDRVAVVRRS